MYTISFLPYDYNIVLYYTFTSWISQEYILYIYNDLKAIKVSYIELKDSQKNIRRKETNSPS